jgi:hypothetical protein
MTREGATVTQAARILKISRSTAYAALGLHSPAGLAIVPVCPDPAARGQAAMPRSAALQAHRGRAGSSADRRTTPGPAGTVHRRCPDKEPLAEALFESASRRWPAQAGPDSWTGPVSFPEGACTQLATDRGRGRMKPLVTALVRRAQRDG